VLDSGKDALEKGSKFIFDFLKAIFSVQAEWKNEK
jgi:hypothetical protein